MNIRVFIALACFSSTVFAQSDVQTLGLNTGQVGQANLRKHKTPLPPVQPPNKPVNLGLAGQYAILAAAGVSTVPPSTITGNIGVSPIAATAMTGFSLTLDPSGLFSTSDQVTSENPFDALP